MLGIFLAMHPKIAKKRSALPAMSWEDLTALAGQDGLTRIDYQAFEVEFLRREVLFQKEASQDADRHHKVAHRKSSKNY
jgi:hypothetical protein